MARLVHAMERQPCQLAWKYLLEGQTRHEPPAALLGMSELGRRDWQPVGSCVSKSNNLDTHPECAITLKKGA